MNSSIKLGLIVDQLGNPFKCKNLDQNSIQSEHSQINNFTEKYRMQTVLPSQQDLKAKLFHKQSIQLSDRNKYPELFKWKTASLVIGSLCSVLLIVLVVVIYDYEIEGQKSTNLTFLQDLIRSTQILKDKKQIVNLSNNLQEVYGTTKFQNAKLLKRTNVLTQNMIRWDIFGQQSQKLLFLVDLQHSSGQTTHEVRFAAYMNSPFPLPQNQDFNSSLTYYSFQIKQQRKSSLLSLQFPYQLKLSTKNPEIKSISQCRNYVFQPNQDQGVSFELLNSLISFSLQESKQNSVTFNVQGWKCFAPEFNTQEEFKEMLGEILNVRDWQLVGEKLKVKLMQVYHLA